MPLQVSLLLFCNTVYQKFVLKILRMITGSSILKFSLAVLPYFGALRSKPLRNTKKGYLK